MKRLMRGIAAAVLLLAAGTTGLMQLPEAYTETFTGRRFAMVSHTNFLNRGYVTYYEKTGLWLHSPIDTVDGEVLGDEPFFLIDAQDIYVNATFMGQGASFPMRDSAISLSRMRGRPFELRRETADFLESLSVTQEEIVYYRSDTAQKESVKGSVYAEFLEAFPKLPLAGFPKEDGEAEIWLTLDFPEGGSEWVCIDGKDCFEWLLARFEEAAGLEKEDGADDGAKI